MFFLFHRDIEIERGNQEHVILFVRKNYQQ